MYKNKKILALIPARAGSKGIKNKNLALLSGKPLIQYTIEASQSTDYIDKVIVSTDGIEISKFVKKLGVDVIMRPAEYANDNSKTVDAVLHTINILRNIGECFDSVVLLQPTSPLRTNKEIDNAIETYYQQGKSLVSVSPVENNPILIRTISADGILKPLLSSRSDVRRQDFSDFYVVNGSIYINDFNSITKDTSFNDNEVAFISNSPNIDIDTPNDLLFAEYVHNYKIK